MHRRYASSFSMTVSQGTCLFLLSLSLSLALSPFLPSSLPLQLEHHPHMMRYQAENFSLREEVCSLRALDSVKSAQLAAEQCTTELEEAFHKLAASEKPTRDTSGKN